MPTKATSGKPGGKTPDSKALKTMSDRIRDLSSNIDGWGIVLLIFVFVVGVIGVVSCATIHSDMDDIDATVDEINYRMILVREAEENRAYSEVHQGHNVVPPAPCVEVILNLNGVLDKEDANCAKDVLEKNLALHSLESKTAGTCSPNFPSAIDLKALRTSARAALLRIIPENEAAQQVRAVEEYLGRCPGSDEVLRAVNEAKDFIGIR